MPQDDTIFLKTQVDVLSFLDVGQLRKVTPEIEHAGYAKGDMVLLKGEVTSGLYIVKKGKVSVLARASDGVVKTHELAAGDFFGEISMLENTAATASVKASEDDTEVLVIPHHSFQKLIEAQPLLKKALLDRVASRKAL